MYKTALEVTLLRAQPLLYARLRRRWESLAIAFATSASGLPLCDMIKPNTARSRPCLLTPMKASPCDRHHPHAAAEVWLPPMRVRAFSVSISFHGLVSYSNIPLRPPSRPIRSPIAAKPAGRVEHVR